jgi:hypothetical protein
VALHSDLPRAGNPQRIGKHGRQQQSVRREAEAPPEEPGGGRQRDER